MTNDIALAAHVDANDALAAAYEETMYSSPAFLAWQAQQEEEQYEANFLAWSADQRENGEDDSRDAYETYLEGFLPED